MLVFGVDGFYRLNLHGGVLPDENGYTREYNSHTSDLGLWTLNGLATSGGISNGATSRSI